MREYQRQRRAKLKAENPKATEPESQPFDKTKYQRALMRERRAKERADKIQAAITAFLARKRAELEKRVEISERLAEKGLISSGELQSRMEKAKVQLATIGKSTGKICGLCGQEILTG